jgi:hypothetical protein
MKTFSIVVLALLATSCTKVVYVPQDECPMIVKVKYTRISYTGHCQYIAQDCVGEMEFNAPTDLYELGDTIYLKR